MILALLLAGCAVSQRPSAPDTEAPEPEVEPCAESTWYADADGDGFGDAASPLLACEAPAMHVADASDCDDHAATVYPGAADPVCDAVDRDCDGIGADPKPAAAIGAVEYGTINEAVAAALDGETVLICPGTWTESLVLTERSLTLASASGSAEDTGFDGLGHQTPLVVYGGSVVVRELGFANGRATIGDPWFEAQGAAGIYSGGAIHAESAALTVQSCRFDENVAEQGEPWSRGGAIFASAAPGLHAALTITDSAFYGNRSAFSGGAVTLDGQLGTVSGTISGSTFEGNTAAGEGGAVAAWGADFDVGIERCTFVNNYASRASGALSAGGSGAASLAVSGSTFEGNLSGNTGGAVGVDLHDGARFALSDSVFRFNDAAEGGGLYADLRGGELRIDGSLFEENTSERGGGVSIQGSEGGPAGIYETSIVGNTAEYGGGLRYESRFGGAALEIVGATIDDNVAHDGGGLYLAPDDAGSTQITLSESSVSGNEAYKGGGISVQAWSADGVNTLRATDTDLLDNAASGSGGAIYVSGPAAISLTGGAVTGTTSISYSAAFVSNVDCDLSSSGVDWGSAADDNDPADVSCASTPYSYGAAASFTCDGTGCS